MQKKNLLKFILFYFFQILVFRVQSHPLYPSFLLCSNSDYFLSLSKEIMYNLLSLIVMYFAPLLVIVVTYAMVLYTIARKSREHHQDCSKFHQFCTLFIFYDMRIFIYVLCTQMFHCLVICRLIEQYKSTKLVYSFIWSVMTEGV